MEYKILYTFYDEWMDFKIDKKNVFYERLNLNKNELVEYGGNADNMICDLLAEKHRCTAYDIATLTYYSDSPWGDQGFDEDVIDDLITKLGEEFLENLISGQNNPVFEKAFKKKKEPNQTRSTYGMFSDIFGGLNDRIASYFQEAVEDYKLGRLNSALKNINKILEKYDVNEWKHYAFRANIFEDLRGYEDAINDYKKAIEYSEEDFSVYSLYHQIGFCYLNLGNNEKANEFYSYAIELKKKHPNSSTNPDKEGMDMGIMVGVPFKRLYNNRANALKNLNKLEEALNDCMKSLEFDQFYSNPYIILFQIYVKTGQTKKAIGFLKKSAELGNQNAIFMLNKLNL